MCGGVIGNSGNIDAPLPRDPAIRRNWAQLGAILVLRKRVLLRRVARNGAQFGAIGESNASQPRLRTRHRPKPPHRLCRRDRVGLSLAGAGLDHSAR